MIKRVKQVFVDETGDSPNINYAVSKMVVQEPDTLGESVNTIPERVEVYNGTDRLAAQDAADNARREMYQ